MALAEHRVLIPPVGSSQQQARRVTFPQRNFYEQWLTVLPRAQAGSHNRYEVFQVGTIERPSSSVRTSTPGHWSRQTPIGQNILSAGLCQVFSDGYVQATLCHYEYNESFCKDSSQHVDAHFSALTLLEFRIGSYSRWDQGIICLSG